jgi:hypothetical protein
LIEVLPPGREQMVVLADVLVHVRSSARAVGMTKAPSTVNEVAVRARK